MGNRWTSVVWLGWLVACGGTRPDGAPSDPGQAAGAETLAEVPAPVADASELAAWKARHEREGTSPEGAIKIWLEAALLYSADGGKREATATEVLGYLTIPFKDNPAWTKLPTNRTFVERLASEPHLFRSYAVGATPDNGYAMDLEKWSLHVDRIEAPIDDRGTRVFLVSGGADSPRPVYCKQSEQTGLWYVNIHANTYVGIRPIVDPDRETFR